MGLTQQEFDQTQFFILSPAAIENICGLGFRNLWSDLYFQLCPAHL